MARPLDRALVNHAPADHGRSGFDPSRCIGFTGTQHRWTAEQRSRLAGVLSCVRQAGFEWMLNGDCLGSDERAASLWKGFDGLIHLYPPDNPRKRAFILASRTEPERPYLDRNRNIARDCRALIATPQEDFEQLRSGTWATIRHARKLGKPICIVWPGEPPTTENWRGGWGAPLRDSDDSPVAESDAPKGSDHDH